MDYRSRIDRLDFLVGKLKEKLSLIEEIYQIEPIITNEDMVYEAQKELNAFIAAQEIASTSYSLHVKKVEEAFRVLFKG